MINYPSARARSYVGSTVEVTADNPKRAGQGVVIDVRRTTSILDTTTGEIFPAVQFCIKSSDGRVFWTYAYPDREESQ